MQHITSRRAAIRAGNRFTDEMHREIISGTAQEYTNPARAFEAARCLRLASACALTKVPREALARWGNLWVRACANALRVQGLANYESRYEGRCDGEAARRAEVYDHDCD